MEPIFLIDDWQGVTFKGYGYEELLPIFGLPNLGDERDEDALRKFLIRCYSVFYGDNDDAEIQKVLNIVIVLRKFILALIMDGRGNYNSLLVGLLSLERYELLKALSYLIPIMWT